GIAPIRPQSLPSTFKPMLPRNSGYRHQNPDKSPKNKGILEKRWKGAEGGQQHISYYTEKFCDSFDRLVCDQEIADSIPFVYTLKPRSVFGKNRRTPLKYRGFR